MLRPQRPLRVAGSSGSQTYGRRAAVKVLPADSRGHNLSLVLQRLVDDGPLSRADLARATTLTRVTVSDLVGELIEDGLVSELGPRPGTRTGKPATLLGVVPGAAHIVALDLSDASVLRGAVLDLAGTVLTRETVELGRARGADALQLVLALAERLVASTSSYVLGLGIGTPGIVNGHGVVRHAPNLGWHDVALAQTVRTRVGLPVSVANDANVAALAEATFGSGGGAGLLLVAVGHGVGGAIMLDGSVVDGPRRSAGEIGHIVVERNGLACACGNRGCLETVLAAPCLRARIVGLGEQAVDAELATAGSILGSAIAPIVTALGLRDVVLHGPDDLLNGPLLDAARSELTSLCGPLVAAGPVARMASLPYDLAVLAGVAAQVRFARLGVV